LQILQVKGIKEYCEVPVACLNTSMYIQMKYNPRTHKIEYQILEDVQKMHGYNMRQSKVNPAAVELMPT